MQSQFFKNFCLKYFCLINLCLKYLRSISVLSLALVAVPVVANADQAAQTILIFGDSIAAGYGLQQAESWTALLQQRLNLKHYNAKVVNASISGETTSGGLSRIDGTLKQHQPTIILLELGANDGLRGLELTQIDNNLNAILSKVGQFNAKCVLIGMKIPPNYGLSYTKGFSALFSKLATQHNAQLVPFLLEGVAGKPALMQADGLHPKAEAQKQLLENVWPTLLPLLLKPTVIKTKSN